MKATDEYKVCTLEEAETFARKREHMNKKNFPPHIVDGGASYQKKVEEAPYHPGYEDAVVTPAPKYTGMNSEMSAYDLANEVMEHYNAEKQKGFNVNWMQEVANKLRKQADRIAELEEENEQLYKAMERAFEGLETMIEFSKALSKEKSK